MSLRRRLVVGLIAVAAVLVLGNVALSRTVEGYLLDRVDRQLADVASRPVFRGDRVPRPAGGGGETLTEYFIAVGRLDGTALRNLTSAFADADESPPRLDRGQIRANLGVPGTPVRPFTAPSQQGREQWRLVAVQDPTSGTLSVVGIRLDDVRATIARIRVVQTGVTVAVLASLGLVSWWMLRLGVDPIEHVAATADAIAAGDLSHRAEHPSETTEAGRLGAAFNAMLGRIEEAFKAREASEERVRRFAADASHELRTPLTSIRGYAELWRAGGLREPAELDDAMRRMEQEAERMGVLVDDLLLLARLDQSRPLDLAPVRLDLLVNDAVSDARAVEPGRPIDVSTAPVEVAGDEKRLRQVIANLLANVRTHTPPDAAVRVALGTDEARTRARLTVADTGPGMAPEVAARVFERFYRADPSRARVAGGTGLGLAIVRAVVEAHNGTVALDSEEGRGTTVTVDLPL